MESTIKHSNMDNDEFREFSVRLLMESTVKHGDIKAKIEKIIECPSPDGVDCQARRSFYN